MGVVIKQKGKNKMKRFLTCALCFVSLPAVATVTLWYEQDGACPGLYRSKPATACNATAVSHLTVTPADDTTFTGFYVNGQMIVDANGNVTSNALNILLDANLSGPVEIPQTYTCPDGTTETGYGECESSASMITVKLDTRGGSMSKTSQFKAVQGARLTAYVPDRSSFDGAIFAGWVRSDQQDSAASRNATVNAPAGSTVTYRAVYTCPDGHYMNQYNVCVVEGEDYFDTQGRSVSPDQLQCWRPTGPGGSYQNYCHWNLLVTLYDNNTNPGKSFGVTYPNSQGGNNGKTLTCYGGTGCRAADWCKENRGDIHQGGTCMSLWVPQATDYEFRGYFKQPKNPEDLITDVGTTDGGAFSVFYRTNQLNNYMNITGRAVVVVEPYNTVDLWCQPLTGGNGHVIHYGPDNIPECNGDLVDITPYPISVYAGWARKCPAENIQHTQQYPFSCDLRIGDSFTPDSNGFGKGDVKYITSCDDGYGLNGSGNVYNPQCVKEAGDTLSINYQFVDQYGFAVNGCNVSSTTCEVPSAYNLPHLAVCGSNNPLKYLSTYNGLYTPSHSVTCGSTVFGNTSPRTVTGYVCRYSCQKGDTVTNGTCGSVPQQGGTINGNEYVNNLWDGCNKIECNRGYVLQLSSDGTLSCVMNGVVTPNP